MKRMIVVVSFFSIFLLVISIRIFYISTFKNNEYKDRMTSQSSLVIQKSMDRNNIYDRNLISFTNAGKKKIGVVVKSEDQDADFSICEILDKENVYKNFNILYKNNVVYIPVRWDFNENLVSEYKNVKIIEDVKRYNNSGNGAAVIGYILDGKGVTGIEYVADDYLNTKGENTTVIRDANGKYLPGISFKAEENNGVSLKTTLDKRYTDICQNAFKDIFGSAVLLEVPSFDLIAMVSSPSFNRNNVENYLNDSSEPLINRAIQNYDMGSVFKIVVTAAALENRSINSDEKFDCNGIKRIGNVDFLCNNHEKSDSFSLSSAFLASCNSVFIDIGLKTGYNNIISMARSFGFSDRLILPEKFPQNAGILPDENNYYLADVANISIGQGKLMGTPVHGAVLSCIIASGGIRRQINCLDSLIDDKFKTIKNLRSSEQTRVISEDTAEIIKNLMIDTVKYGTGKGAESKIVSCAGKTGSAETGITKNGEKYVHAWFTGFFPIENPRYALCVFIENGKSGALSAAPVFKKIMEEICKLEGIINE